jgi:hypothetical protein
MCPFTGCQSLKFKWNEDLSKHLHIVPKPAERIRGYRQGGVRGLLTDTFLK